MKKFIAVIGKRNSGKSTVIASLTGCRTHTFRGWVTDLDSNYSIYVIASSPQELSLSLRELRNILKQVIEDEHCRGLVMAIQPSNPRVRLRLSLEQIIKEIQSAKSFDLHLFALEPARKDPDGFQSVLPKINNHLKNSGLVTKVLNGKRFAFVNAREINQSSKLF